MPSPTGVTWLTSPERGVVAFDGPLKAATLNAASWSVRHLSQQWTSFTAVASGSEVTLTKIAGQAAISGWRVAYDGVAGDLQSPSGVPLDAFVLTP